MKGSIQSLLESKEEPKWKTNGSFEQLSEIVGCAFAGTKKCPGEPSIIWLLKGVMNIQDYYESNDKENAAAAAFTYYLSFTIHKLLKRGSKSFCHTSDNDDETTGRRELKSAVIFCEYDPQIEHAPKPFWDSWMDHYYDFSLELGRKISGTIIPAPFDKLSSESNKTLSERAENFGSVTKEAHQMYGPKEKHLYVYFIAVDPECQGKGLGKQLLNQLAAISDTTGMAIYLECSGDKNKAMYEKYGYKNTGTNVFEGENGENCFNYAMVREPQIGSNYCS